MRLALVVLAAAAAWPLPVRADELLYFPEGNRLRRLDVDTLDGKKPARADVLIQNAGAEGGGGEKLFVSPNRDVNGMLCVFPDGSGRFVMGEDTRQPSPPPGFGVFERNGQQVGKLTPTFFSAQGEPYGCAFASDPDPDDGLLPPLFTTDVGAGSISGSDGQLILWFPPYTGYPGDPFEFPETDAPSTSFCKIASDIATAGAVAVDGEGRVYVASASADGLGRIERFLPPFPSGPDAAGGCSGTDALGSPVADTVTREEFASASLLDGMLSFTGLALGPNGNLFASAVATGRIAEYDLDGNLLRVIVDPGTPPLPPTFPTPTGSPQGLAFGEDGTLYYADLDLTGTFPDDVGPGDDGKIRRVRFDKRGEPLPPEVLVDGLAFPDAVAVLPGDLERKKAGGRGKTEWRAYAGGPLRQFVNPKEKKLKAGKLAQLRERWRFRSGAIVTASPSVASLEVPDEGRIQLVYFTSWDNNVYALRLSDGSKLWHFTADVQPGSEYPAASSPVIERVGERELAFVGLGEVLYALDAVTGEEVWRFTAGTGCVDGVGDPPGLCAFDGERNQIETSPIVADGKVFFGMDVNDVPLGKGGFYAVDAADGRLAWFFDLESAATCTPEAGEEIRAFDGYHSELELGLPAGFLARPGCDFDRTPTGCGNVWSSPAVDEERGLVFFGSSNCDTDDDPGTPLPPPPMPPHDCALTALRFDGTPAWRWRPREVDNDDLAFGATPNLFTLKLGKRKVDVVGIGGKDGSYYVLDRDGVNELTGEGFDPSDALALPYWFRNLVPGGIQGGVIGTPAVDAKSRRIYVATAQGQADPPSLPQQPTVHALDLDTGEILWQAGTGQLPDGEASFGPVSATRKLVIVPTIVFQNLRFFDAKTGALLERRAVGDSGFGGVASGATVVDGNVVVGSGIGALSGDPNNISTIAARTPSSVVALCVPGSKGCPK